MRAMVFFLRSVLLASITLCYFMNAEAVSQFNGSGKNASKGAYEKFKGSSQNTSRCNVVLSNKEFSFKSGTSPFGSRVFPVDEKPVTSKNGRAKKLYPSVEYWANLDFLVRFLRNFNIYNGELDFIQNYDFTELKSVLRENVSLPSKISMQLKNIEMHGYSPLRTEPVLNSIKQLMVLARQDRLDPCPLKGCSEHQRWGELCLYKNCETQVTKTPHFSFDGELDYVHHIEYPVVVSHWGEELILWERRELELDAGTGVIRAQNPAGDLLVENLLQKARLAGKRGKPWAFIFMDLNNLGLINYFWEGPPAGDSYIKSYADAVKRYISAKDHFFRIGGDEFVLISEHRSTLEIKSLIKKIMYDFFASRAANRIFEHQWRLTESAIKELERTKDFYSLRTTEASQLLQSKWMQEAESDFVSFRKKLMEEYIPILQDHLKLNRYLMRPSFSVGIKLISEDDTFNALKTLANDQSRESKKHYKESQGANAIKVGGRETDEELILDNIDKARFIIPPVFDPL